LPLTVCYCGRQKCCRLLVVGLVVSFWVSGADLVLVLGLCHMLGVDALGFLVVVVESFVLRGNGICGIGGAPGMLGIYLCVLLVFEVVVGGVGHRLMRRSSLPGRGVFVGVRFGSVI
jgi:hypothetical protein